MIKRIILTIIITLLLTFWLSVITNARNKKDNNKNLKSESGNLQFKQDVKKVEKNKKQNKRGETNK